MPDQATLNFLMDKPLAFVILLGGAWWFIKAKEKSDALMLGLVEKCTTALNNNTAAMQELRKMVSDLQVEVRHVASHDATQKMHVVCEG